MRDRNVIGEHVIRVIARTFTGVDGMHSKRLGCNNLSQAPFSHIITTA